MTAVGCHSFWRSRPQEVLPVQPGSHGCMLSCTRLDCPCQDTIPSWKDGADPWLPDACLPPQDSLGGNSRTLMIACISAADDSLDGGWHGIGSRQGAHLACPYFLQIPQQLEVMESPITWLIGCACSANILWDGPLLQHPQADMLPCHAVAHPKSIPKGSGDAPCLAPYLYRK
jgi:hypothetical protein